MRVSQRDVHGLQGQGVPHLTPVGGDHIGRGRQTGGTAELRHHFTSREALFSPARILRVGQHAFQLLADGDRFIKRPGPVRIQRHARLRETFSQGGDSFRLFFPGQHPTLQFEIIKTIFFIRGFRQAHHRIRRHRFIVAEPVPVAFLVRLALVRQRRQFAVTNKEQIAQHFHFTALLPLTQQGSNVNPQVLA